MATSREEALLALGRYGKVTGGNGHFYGRIAEVHTGGDNVLFERRGRFKPVWRHRNDLDLHGTSRWAFQGPVKPTTLTDA